MSAQEAKKRAVVNTFRKVKSGNIFAVVGIPFEILGSLSDIEIENLSNEYQKKWDAYKKQHSLDINEIEAETRRIKRLYVTRLLYDEISFKQAKNILAKQVAEQQKMLNETASSSNVLIALKELTLTHNVSNSTILIFGLMLVSLGILTYTYFSE